LNFPGIAIVRAAGTAGQIHPAALPENGGVEN
jgi:hypothetical protein